MKVTVKKSRTRFIAIAAALICTLSLTACNSNGTSSQTESSNTVNSWYLPIAVPTAAAVTTVMKRGRMK